ncbi:MAG: putative toxin-antitoxin system toxin component, PIN family [Nitrospirota bacterium]
MIVVLDTNVFISGLIRPYGKPAKILALLISGEIEIAYDSRILNEYKEVSHRPQFEIDKNKLKEIIDYIEDAGILAPGLPIDINLNDPDDEIFLEVACFTGAEVLITGNLRHFPEERYKYVLIMNPEQFLTYFTQQIKKGAIENVKDNL